MKKLLFSVSAALALGTISVPAVAQDADADGDLGALAMGFAAELGVEPLTPEQEARLPLARRILDQVIPDGVMGETMDGLLGGSLGELSLDSAIDPNAALDEALGYNFALDIGTQEAEEAMAIIDPSWRERAEAQQALTVEALTTMMDAMEPTLREAMAELYAVHFTEDQLNDIAAFYATPTGAVFARASITMSSDPRLYASIMGSEEFWQSIAGFATVEEADLPESGLRAFSDLSLAERQRLARLTGQTLEDLEYAMTWQASDAVEAETKVGPYRPGKSAR